MFQLKLIPAIKYLCESWNFIIEKLKLTLADYKTFSRITFHSNKLLHSINSNFWKFEYIVSMIKFYKS